MPFCCIAALPSDGAKEWPTPMTRRMLLVYQRKVFCTTVKTSQFCGLAIVLLHIFC